MTKQASGSPYVERTPTGHGERVRFVQPRWQQECDAYDGGRQKPPTYRPADGDHPILEVHAGEGRKIIQS